MSYAGFALGEGSNNLGSALQITTNEPAGGYAPAGSYQITPSGLTSANYAIAFVNGTLAVTPASLTVTAAHAAKTYGSADPIFAVSYQGFAAGEGPSNLAGSLLFATNEPGAGNAPVGSYQITPFGFSSGNYAITFVRGALDVTQAPLMVTANPVTKLYGDPDPAFTASYAGFAPGDGPSNLDGALLFTTNEPGGIAPVGSYLITPSGLAASTNYSIAFVAGTLKVNPGVSGVVVAELRAKERRDRLRRPAVAHLGVPRQQRCRRHAGHRGRPSDDRNVRPLCHVNGGHELLGRGVQQALLRQPHLHDPIDRHRRLRGQLYKYVPGAQGMIDKPIVTQADPSLRQGNLLSNEQVVITWAIDCCNPLANQSFTVDGMPVSQTFGPYAAPGPNTTYWSGLAGPLFAGNHFYNLQVTDTSGNIACYSGNFAVQTGMVDQIVMTQTNPSLRTTHVLSGQSLAMSWAINDANSITQDSLTIDGRAITGITGPAASPVLNTYYCGSVIGSFAVGDHSYTIQVTDSTGKSASYNSTFTVYPSALTISGVVVAEANPPKNGILESDEQLVITWATSGPVPYTTSGVNPTLTVNGRVVAFKFGPFGPYDGYMYYSGAVIGPLAAGTHTYSLQAAGVSGVSGSFTVYAATALTLDVPAVASGNATVLSDAQLQPIVAEAENRLTAATGVQVAAAMSGVSIEITDLPGNMLGEALGKTILIDRDAAGYGWFVDSTPADDLEFADPLGPYAWAATDGSPAAGRVDLLTTVMHEMGHVLGLGHDDTLDLMYHTLSLGQRRRWPTALLAAAEAVNNSAAGAAQNEGDARDKVFALL